MSALLVVPVNSVINLVYLAGLVIQCVAIFANVDLRDRNDSLDALRRAVLHVDGSQIIRQRFACRREPGLRVRTRLQDCSAGCINRDRIAGVCFGRVPAARLHYKRP